MGAVLWQSIAVDGNHMGDKCVYLTFFRHIFLHFLQLQFKTVADAVSGVLDCLGMQACENSASPQAKSKTHNLFMSGSFSGSCRTLARAQISLASSGDGTVLKVTVKQGLMCFHFRSLFAFSRLLISFASISYVDRCAKRAS